MLAVASDRPDADGPDLGAVRQFYGDQFEPDVLIESDDIVTFRCGGASRLVLTRTSEPSSEQTTKASVAEPGLRTVDGVADAGLALSAWLVDPGGNTIGLLQFKDETLA